MPCLKQAKLTEHVATRASTTVPETQHHPRSSDLVLDLLSLQHAVGNQEVTRLLQPHNADEQEAERVAHRIVNSSPTQDAPSEIQPLSPIAPSPAADTLSHHLGSGAPLSPSQRATKESDEDVEGKPAEWPLVASDEGLKEMERSVSAAPKQSTEQFLQEASKIEARCHIQDLLSAPSLDIDKAFDVLRNSYDAQPLIIKHRVRASDLAPRGVRGHVAGGETGKVGDIHPVHFLENVILYRDEAGQPQLLHYLSKASVQDFTDLALPTRGDFTGFDKARDLPGVVTSRAILQQLGGGAPDTKDRRKEARQLAAGHRVLPLGTLGMVRFPGHTGVAVRNAEVGNFHTAGEVTTRTAREGNALEGASGLKFDWDAGPPSVQYDMLLRTSAQGRQFTKDELSVTAIRARLEVALRNRLQERLVQLPK